MQDTDGELESTNDARATSCVVVGGGPVGAMLALLLARGSAPVAHVDSYEDFQQNLDREAVHPAVMEVLEELGLAENRRGSANREVSLTVPTVLVVPAERPADGQTPEPALEISAEKAARHEDPQPGTGQEEADGAGAPEDAASRRGASGEESAAGESEFELGRAQGRIELLEQELRRRERELDELRRDPSGQGPERM